MQTHDLAPYRTTQVLMLTTTGRRYDCLRNVELWFVVYGDRLAVMAEHGQGTGWVKNLKKTPQAGITFQDVSFSVVARILDSQRDRQEWQQVAHLFQKKYDWGDGLPVVLDPVDAST